MPAQFSLINLDNKSQWDEINACAPHSIYHTWEYCNCLKSHYKSPIELLNLRNNDSGLTLIFTRRSKNSKNFDIHSIYGFGGYLFWGDIDNHFLESLDDYMISKKIVSAYIMGYPNCGHDLAPFAENGRTIYLIDLREELSDIFQNMHENHRYEIRRSLKCKNIKFIKNKDITEKAFYELYYQTLLRTNANKTYHFSKKTLSSLIESNFSQLFGLSINGEVEACTLILNHQNTSEYFLNASSEKGRLHSRMLLWKIIEILKRDGGQLLNLGGGIKEKDSLDSFKRKFGGKSERIPVFKKVFDTKNYNFLCKNFVNDIDSSSNTFPPYWN